MNALHTQNIIILLCPKRGAIAVMSLKAQANIIPVSVKPNNGPKHSYLVFVTEGAVENTNCSKITGADRVPRRRRANNNAQADSPRSLSHRDFAQDTNLCRKAD